MSEASANHRGPILLIATALVAGVLLAHPERYQGADYIGYALRVTAWLSAGFFLLAYLARPLAKLGVARSLVRNRRYLGLSVAISHTVHFGYVVAFSRLPGVEIDLITTVFGGAAFVLMWLMALTSNDASVRRLRGNWKRLHSTGMHYLWFIFAFTFFGGATDNLISALFVAAFIAAAGVRLYVYSRQRQTETTVEPS